MPRTGFAPYFWTQFLGAFNDNYYKIACTMLVTYRIAGMPAGEVAGLVALAAGLFILPFFLFSATAGQLADRFDKVILIRWIKFAEILIMGGAVAGFVATNIPLLLAVIFLMGAQSAFFGPVKYSIIPELVPEDKLIRSNGLVETGTFVSILTGTIFGSFSIALTGDPFVEVQARLLAGAGIRTPLTSPTALLLTAGGVLLLALTGFLCSLRLPRRGGGDASVRIEVNLAAATWRVLRFAGQSRAILRTVLSISLFWFYGAFLLQAIPVYTRFYLQGGETVFTLALTMFSVGIGAGSFFCSVFSKGKINLKLSGLGLLGFILFPLAAAAVGRAVVPVLAALFLIGVAGGLYIVPLYSWLQDYCPSATRSRTIAAGCILDALFMVAASFLYNAASGLGGAVLLVPAGAALAFAGLRQLLLD